MNKKILNSQLNRWELLQLVYNAFKWQYRNELSFREIKKFVEAAGRTWNHATCAQCVNAGALQKKGSSRRETFYVLGLSYDPGYDQAATVVTNASILPIIKKMEVSSSVQIISVTRTPINWESQYKKAQSELEELRKENLKLKKELEKTSSYKEDAVKFRNLKALLNG